MTERKDGPDRRDMTRAPIELRVEYRRLNMFFADYTRNISKGGTFIRTNTPLDIGTEFVFSLVVPTLKEPLSLVGKVMWTVAAERGTEDQPAGMGIEFQYRDAEERSRIAAFVYKAMARELGEELAARLLVENES
ncbi:MAG: TIGR02266 family protein [Polyangiaceae bacterium]|jgi:type IV pilus assembly protein PilZ|nr:TIGR02266 family protein [Polyangiaceae bacterium]